VKEFIAAELDKSRLALAAAKAVVQIDPNSSANRAYYAAFHVFTGYFASVGQSFAKHSALRSAIHRDLIHAGRLDDGIGQDFDFLMDLRESGDYGGLVRVTATDANAAIETAQRICEAILPLIQTPAG
jgi:uncharacterized protein (UPF0332 family)